MAFGERSTNFSKFSSISSLFYFFFWWVVAILNAMLSSDGKKKRVRTRTSNHRVLITGSSFPPFFSLRCFSFPSSSSSSSPR